MTQIIDGKALAAKTREEIAARVSTLTDKGRRPGLAVILIGDNPASHIYVTNKVKACEKTGIKSFEYRLPASITEDEVLQRIIALNKNADIHGILIQLPVPDHLNPVTLVSAIAPHKDVDGLHPVNAGRLINGLPAPIPCTPKGCIQLIDTILPDITRLHAVVIGRSLLFGKPMGQLLLNKNATVTMCHSKTKDLPSIATQADILIAAAGQPKLVKDYWVKEGSIVIDVGINYMDDGTICGDVDFDAVQGKVRAITPVPGGVGPMTITCLLQNTVEACENT